MGGRKAAARGGLFGSRSNQIMKERNYMTPELVAAFISLAISWLCIAKAITNTGWKKWALIVLAALFFLSWLGNSAFLLTFGTLGLLAGAVLTVIFGVMYGKDQKDKVRN